LPNTQKTYRGYVCPCSEAVSFGRIRSNDLLQPDTVEAVEEAAPKSAVLRAWAILTGDDTIRRSSFVAWLLLLLVVIYVVQGTLRFDFRDQPIAGDQTTFLMQALSLSGHGHNLSYDAADMDRWRAIGWAPQPTALFFQHSPWGWAFAKPYGYSLYLAGFIWALGAPHGIAVANSVLLLALVALSIAILRLLYRGPVVPLVVLAFVFTSNAYFYGYVMHEELLLAVATAAIGYGTLRFLKSGAWGWSLATVVLMAAVLPEKPQFVVLFGPLGLAMLWREPRVIRKIVLVVVGVVVLFGSTFPYRHYSGGTTWNAYQGDRYTTSGRTPFDHPNLAAPLKCPPICTTAKELSLTSVEGLRTRIEEGKGQFASVFYYFFGRYTGLLVFMPFALLTIGVVLILYRRRLDAPAWLILGAIGAYIAVNVAVYPNNYYGGGQSLGDRYFLQMAPMVLVLLVAARVASKTAVVVALASIVLGVAFLYPHDLHPSEAYVRIDKTSALQRLLPVERNQEKVDFFQCPIYGDCAATATVIKGFKP
jgi:hypothetical protein